MLNINGSKISFVRGDTGYLQVTIHTRTGEFYIMQEGDSIAFHLFKKRKGKKIEESDKVLTKILQNRTLTLEPEDTFFLQCGVYYYKIILTKADGEVQTINYGPFVLTK